MQSVCLLAGAFGAQWCRTYLLLTATKHENHVWQLILGFSAKLFIACFLKYWYLSNGPHRESSSAATDSHATCAAVLLLLWSSRGQNWSGRDEMTISSHWINSKDSVVLPNVVFGGYAVKLTVAFWSRAVVCTMEGHSLQPDSRWMCIYWRNVLLTLIWQKKVPRWSPARVRGVDVVGCTQPGDIYDAIHSSSSTAASEAVKHQAAIQPATHQLWRMIPIWKPSAPHRTPHKQAEITAECFSLSHASLHLATEFSIAVVLTRWNGEGNCMKHSFSSLTWTLSTEHNPWIPLVKVVETTVLHVEWALKSPRISTDIDNKHVKVSFQFAVCRQNCFEICVSREIIFTKLGSKCS